MYLTVVRRELMTGETGHAPAKSAKYSHPDHWRIDSACAKEKQEASRGRVANVPIVQNWEFGMREDVIRESPAGGGLTLPKKSQGSLIKRELSIVVVVELKKIKDEGR